MEIFWVVKFEIMIAELTSVDVDIRGRSQPKYVIKNGRTPLCCYLPPGGALQVDRTSPFFRKKVLTNVPVIEYKRYITMPANDFFDQGVVR